MRVGKRLLLFCLFACAALFIFGASASAEERYHPFPAAIHISTTVSDGRLSPAEVLALAREKNIRVVIFGDHYDVRVRYGLWPLRNIVGITRERPSVRRYGIRRYLSDLARIQKENSDLIVIPGMEVTPFYRWQGNPFARTLSLSDWHKHLLVVGLENSQDYLDLPLISQKKQWGRGDVLSLWPVGTFVLGFFFLKRRAGQGAGLVLILVSSFFLLNNFPFRQPRYDLYGTREDVGPYQDLIDSVIKKKGLVFWAHPDQENRQNVQGVALKTRAYSSTLLATHDYTGFAILYEGYRDTGRPGGLWDEALKEYCAGVRKHPAWAMAELDFESGGSFSGAMSDLQTVLLMRDFSRAAALEALAAGRMYVVRGQGRFDLVLDDFSVKDTGSNVAAVMGEEVAVSGTPLIRIAGHIENGQVDPFAKATIRIIRAGEIVKTMEATAPFDLTYTDESGSQTTRIFYRLEIQYPQKLLISNAIFVRFER